MDEGKRRWEETFDTLPIGIALQNGECRILNANRTFAAIFNRPPSEIIGLTCYQVFQGCSFPTSSCLVRRVREVGTVQRGTYMCKSPSSGTPCLSGWRLASNRKPGTRNKKLFELEHSPLLAAGLPYSSLPLDGGGLP